MAKYLLQASYTAEGVKGLLKDGGTARVNAASQLLTALGGTVESFYFALGSSDAYVVVDMPDNATIAAAVFCGQLERCRYREHHGPVDGRRGRRGLRQEPSVPATRVLVAAAAS